MRATKILALLAVLGMVIGACGPAPTPATIRVVETVQVPVEVVETVEVEVEVPVPADITTLRVAMGYIPNHQFAPFYVAFDKGYFTEEGLVVYLDAGNEWDAVAAVAQGRFAFGIASVDTLLLARNQGVPVKYVLRWYNGWPTSIFALASSGITKPEDLIGKTLGFPGPYGANWVAWVLLLQETGLDASQVNVQMIGWTQAEQVSQGLVDAAGGYTVNEPIQLRHSGLEINEILTDDYVHLSPIGIFTSEDFIKSNPEIVLAFVRAFLKGVETAVNDPAAAQAAVMAHVPMQYDPTLVEVQLAADIKYWTGAGKYEAADIAATIAAMLKAGMLTEQLNAEDTFTNEFVEAAGY